LLWGARPEKSVVAEEGLAMERWAKKGERVTTHYKATSCVEGEGEGEGDSSSGRGRESKASEEGKREKRTFADGDVSRNVEGEKLHPCPGVKPV
jgi:hypothetical protein